MEDNCEEIYVAGDVDLTEAEADACLELVAAFYEEQENRAAESNPLISQPHVELADILAKTMRIHNRLSGTKAVLAEAMGDCDSASDAMLRSQDLLQALDSVTYMINRLYYGSCDLVLTMTTDQDLYDAAINAAEKMVAAQKSNAEESCDVP